MQRPKKFIDHPFSYHEEVELRIDDVTNLGAGIGRIDNWVVMVPYSLPGETVLARIFRNHSNYSEGDLIRVVETSPQRVDPVCKLFGQCGGCQFQHWEYSDQLKWKQKRVAEHFSRIGLIDIEVAPAIGSPMTYGYRSKLTPHYARWEKNQDFPIGFLHQGQRRRIIDVPYCPIATKAINEALPAVRESVRTTAPKRKNRGATLLLREGRDGVETKASEIISAQVGSTTYQFIAGEFFQNNPFILETFANYVLDAADSVDTIEHLVDVYCGVGFFSLYRADRFQTVTGIEISSAAIQLAEANALMNGIKNCSFHAGEAESIFENATSPPERTSVILDPPRRGCDPPFLQQLITYHPRRIVYVSCDPATQARDVHFLCENGYVCRQAQPFDMFPQTRHIENVTVLEPNI